MNASMSKTKGPDRRSLSGQDTDFSVAPKQHASAGSLKGVGMLLGIFLTMAGSSWFALTWLAALHDQGLLFNDATVNTVVVSAVIVSLLVLIPVILRTVRTARKKIGQGDGILSTASHYLDSNIQNPLLTKEDFETSFMQRIFRLFSGEPPKPTLADLPGTAGDFQAGTPVGSRGSRPPHRRIQLGNEEHLPAVETANRRIRAKG